MINASQVTEMIRSIWPSAVTKGWIPPAVMGKLCTDISRMKLDAEQINNAMLEHATADHGATNKPVTAKLMARLKAMNLEAVNKQTGEVAEGSGKDDFVEQLRKAQSADNPAAWDQPAWKIIAAHYDNEYTNRGITHFEKMTAAKWVANSLRTYGATFNDSIYAAATIYNIDPVELQELTDESTLKALNSQAVNRKALRKLAAEAERLEETRRERMKMSDVTAGAV